MKFLLLSLACVLCGSSCRLIEWPGKEHVSRDSVMNPQVVANDRETRLF